jgi:acyl-coenzyme A thioesterase PaaI-like protein
MTNSNIADGVSKKGFVKHIGGIDFKKISGNTFEFQSKVQSFNLNSAGISHGGYIAAILDNGMGSAAHQVIDGKRCVTIAYVIKFISAPRENDTLIGKVKISRKTNSLVFVLAELFEKDNLVATASGTWKII